MSTVITHIYNEEFLLPYWLMHHRELFDHGIIIDFESSDSSLSIVRKLVPNWEIVQSPFKEFDALKLDRFVESIERNIKGPRIALTITEFFIGDPSLVKGQMIIPEISLINQEFDEPFIPEIPFHKQRKWGLVARAENVTNDGYHFAKGNGRSLHDHTVNYPLGRHYVPILPCAFLIVRVNDCYVTEEMISRRLQIQNKIPQSDVFKNYGVEHTNFGKGLTRNDLIARQDNQRKISVNLSGILDQATEIQKFSVERSFHSEDNVQFLEMWIKAINHFRYSGEIQPYTASTSYKEEIDYVRNSYESSPVYRITSGIKKVLNLGRNQTK